LRGLAQRYAAALADVALEQDAAEPIRKNLDEFCAALEGSPDLGNFLISPAVSRENKQAVIEKIAARIGAGKVFRNFLLVVSDNRRTGLLPEIASAFHSVLLERMGVAEAQVTSAAELTAGQKKQLNAALERLTGKKVEARYSLAPALMGGAVVRIGSTVYDGSVREQLDRLRARLASE
jgi:F-type H+-transporting ATPase subunit delta